MKKHYLSFILSFVLIVFMSSHLSAVAENKLPGKGTSYTESHIKLKDRMQELWIEHAWWTRSYIVSSLAKIEDQQAVLKRLLQNQVDIGDTIKSYYGEEAGTNLTKLLKEHILIAGKIIDAAKKGDQANVDKLNIEWTRNADQIVAFLTSANPNWNKKELTDMFYLHLKLTNDEVVYRLQKNWENDIRTADLNEEHLIHMADILTEGIVKQFPKKFK